MSNEIIVDANSFGQQMRQEVKDAINNRILKIIMSPNGKLEQELRGNALNGGKRYREFKKIGAFIPVCEKSVTRKHARLIAVGSIVSDDHHIIATAIVSGANTLITEDKDLKKDFRNCNEIDKESGCIPRSGKKISRNVICSRTNTKNVQKLLRTAKAKYKCCECMVNGGGC